MKVDERLKQVVAKALSELKLPEADIVFEHPSDLSMGDYSCNIALVLAKQSGMKPRDLADKIVEKLNSLTKDLPEVGKIDAAGPGFINFYLSPEYFARETAEIIAHREDIGHNATLSGKKVMVEYTDPNPFKPFHIGHLMSNAIGESVSRVIEKSGAKVIRACWQGDVGLHVAKAMWGMLKMNREQRTENRELGVKEWGEAYVDGSKAYEENAEAKAEINKLNKIIFEQSDPEINKLYEDGREMSLRHFEEIYKKLGTRFDHYFFEGTEGRDGIAIVEDNLKKGIFEKSDGAIVFKGEKYGLHTRVFINSQGLPTYETKELGLNKAKFGKEPDLTKSIIITGNEQNDYFKVVLKVLSIIFPEIGAKTMHIGHGMLQFVSGKMSSRKGNVITGESLISQVEEMVAEKIADREMTAEEKEKVKTAVAIGAIKYSILKQAIGGNIIYDFNKSISFEGDSGPYLQYSYARARSVLRKRTENREQRTEKEKLKDVVGQFEGSGDLARLLYRFPEVVERAAKEYEPHYIATYLTELSGAFNNFYAHNPILEAGDKTPWRLAQTEAFSIVMKNGLWLLGIEAPEKM